MWQNPFLNKVSAFIPFIPYNFIQTETLTHVFSVTFAKFLRTPFLQKVCEWLLLKKKKKQINYQFNIKNDVTENHLNHLPEKCNKKTQ